MFPENFTCDICGIETFGGNLCPDCLKTVTFNDGVTCPVCGRRCVRPEICRECKEKLPLYKRAVSPLVYDGGGVALVAKYKNGNAYLKEYFADLLLKSLQQLPALDCAVYVPCDKKTLRRRGYNQVKLLADALTKRTNLPVLKDAVKKVKATEVQKGLNKEGRAKNLKGCFKVTNAAAINGKKVLVLDDVLTTGATADEMCKVLLKAGASEVYVATVASVEDKQSIDKKTDKHVKPQKPTV